MDRSPPISTILRSSTFKPVTITEQQRERPYNMHCLKKKIAELHPLVQDLLKESRDFYCMSTSHGLLANFCEEVFVLIARKVFHANEKLVVLKRGPGRINKALNDYAYQIEDLSNGHLEDNPSSIL